MPMSISNKLYLGASVKKDREIEGQRGQIKRERQRKTGKQRND